MKLYSGAGTEWEKDYRGDSHPGVEEGKLEDRVELWAYEQLGRYKMNIKAYCNTCGIEIPESSLSASHSAYGDDILLTAKCHGAVESKNINSILLTAKKGIIVFFTDRKEKVDTDSHWRSLR